MVGGGIEFRVALTEGELAAARELRLRVFSRGQGVAPEAELDGLDPISTHLVGLLRGSVIATCRLRFPDGDCKLERMVVEPGMRRRGIGRGLVEAAELEALSRSAPQMILHAQRQVEGFYAACGYLAEGDTFFSEGIPHVLMRKRLAASGAPG